MVDWVTYWWLMASRKDYSTIITIPRKSQTRNQWCHCLVGKTAPPGKLQHLTVKNPDFLMVFQSWLLGLWQGWACVLGLGKTLWEWHPGLFPNLGIHMHFGNSHALSCEMCQQEAIANPTRPNKGRFTIQTSNQQKTLDSLRQLLDDTSTALTVMSHWHVFAWVYMSSPFVDWPFAKPSLTWTGAESTPVQASERLLRCSLISDKTYIL